MELTIAVIFIAVLFLLLFLGMRISFALGLTGVVGIAVLKGMGATLYFAGDFPYGVIANFAYVVIPLFVLMGHLAEVSGISSQAYTMANTWLGRLPGGLGMASVAACAMFAAASGSSMATAVAVGKTAIPEMRAYGYDPKLATGCVAAAGTLGILIPPSIVLCLYGILAQESIGALLLAGFFPGAMAASTIMTMIYIRASIDRKIAPQGPSTSWLEKLRSLKWGIKVLIVMLVVMGGLYLGVYTAVEAAAFGVLTTFIFLFQSQGLSGFASLRHALSETAGTMGMLFALLLGAGLFGLFLAIAGFPAALAKFAVNLPLPPIGIVILCLAICIPLGMFLEPTSMLLLTVPIFAPIISSLGYNLIWFGILMTIMCELANITPPVAVNVFVIKGIVPDVPLYDVFRGVAWFAAMDVLIIAILIAFPQISLWLPMTMRN
ncbi:TRAP transporter large permease [Chloroflexota bacterium]